MKSSKVKLPTEWIDGPMVCSLMRGEDTILAQAVKQDVGSWPGEPPWVVVRYPSGKRSKPFATAELAKRSVKIPK